MRKVAIISAVESAFISAFKSAQHIIGAINE
jgi:hypothetical protein